LFEKKSSFQSAKISNQNSISQYTSKFKIQSQDSKPSPHAANQESLHSSPSKSKSQIYGEPEQEENKFQDSFEVFSSVSLTSESAQSSNSSQRVQEQLPETFMDKVQEVVF
jgi:hypothetical protein